MKKKFISFVMAFMLLLVGGFTLAGCDEVPADPTTPPAGETTPTHTHEYVSDLYYTVKDNKAYSYKKCECGEKGAETELANAVIATPTTAQSILDSNIDGKTIVFAGGNYKGLRLRATAETAKAYEPVLVQNSYLYEYSILGDEVSIADLEDTGLYHYVRSIENVEFVGTEEAVFEGLIYSNSTYHNVDIYERPSRIGFDDGSSSNVDAIIDPIRNISCVKDLKYGPSEYGDIGYFEHISIDGITFLNMNFEGSKGRIMIDSDDGFSVIKNVKVKNCSFVTDEKWSHTYIDEYDNNKSKVYERGAVSITYYTTMDNVLVENCVVRNHFQGFYIQNANNISILNNETSGTSHNGIAVQSSDSTNTFKGFVEIKGNKVSDTEDRALRFGSGLNAVIVVEDNEFVSAVDSGNELLKTQKLTNVSFTFRNNTYDGVKMEDRQEASLNVTTNYIISINE